MPVHAMRLPLQPTRSLASTIDHESVGTALNIYAHGSEQMKRDAAKKIDEAIGTVLGADMTAFDASCGDENGEG